MRSLRIAGLALLTLLALISCCITIATADWPPGDLGWDVGPDGITVTYVEPAGAVARAGIRTGDRIVYRGLALPVRVNTIWNLSIGNRETVRFDARRGNKTIHEKATTVPLHRLEWYAHALNRVAAVLYLLLGIGLLYVRPNRMTFAFLLTGLLGFVPWYALLWAEHSTAVFVAAYGTDAALSGLVVFGWLWFVGRFPHDLPQRHLRWLPAAGAAFGLGTTALGWALVANIASSTAPPPPWIFFSFSYVVPTLLAVVVVTALAVSYASTAGADRHRIAPVLLAFSFFVIAYALNVVANFWVTGAILNLVVVAANAAATLLVAVAVTYSVVRNHVMDVRFFVSRAVAYGIMTVGVVGTFAVIGHVLGRVVDMARLADVMSVVVALVIGIFLDAMQRRTTEFVDRVMFRRHYEAARELEKLIDELPSATLIDDVDVALATKVTSTLGLESAALLRAEDDESSFLVRRAFGWDRRAPVTIPRTDELAERLREERRPLAVPGSELVAVPALFGGRLHAIVLYGNHAAGQALDPDELRVLQKLGEVGGAAYEAIEDAAMRVELERLRTETEALRESLRAVTLNPR